MAIKARLLQDGAHVGRGRDFRLGRRIRPIHGHELHDYQSQRNTEQSPA
jgi:hypothetical protein